MTRIAPRPLAFTATLMALGCSNCSSPQRAPLAPRAFETGTAQAAPNEDPRASAVVAEIVAEAASVGALLQADRGLDETARELLTRVRASPGNHAPGARVIQSLAWRAGVNDPIPAVVVMRRSPGQWSAESRNGLRALLSSDRPTHVGAAVMTLDSDELVVFALTQRRVTLGPVPRSVRVGERLSLRGALGDGVHEPVLMLTRPDGSTREQRLGAGPGFEAAVPMDARGPWQVELMASSAQGATVVANFPVYVEVDAPPIPDESLAPRSTDPAAVASELRSLLDETRRRAGLPTLATLPVLASVAQSHCEDMSAHRFVAHVSPRTGGHADRLLRAGFNAGLSLENVARGYDAREIHEGLMASPGHRANVLHATVTHVGIGVSREPDGPAWLVTQVFAEVPRAVDPAAESARLLTQVNALRRARGLAEMEVHPALRAAAEQAARTFFAQPQSEQQRVFQDAARAAQGEAGAFRRVSVSGAFGPRTDGAEQNAALMEPDFRAIGVGVAQGDRPHQPAGSVLVVFVTAVPR